MNSRRTRDFAEWMQIGANVAVILSVLVVLPLYLLQRRDGDQQARQQLAAQMFQRKYEDRVMAAYTKVSTAFDNNNRLFQVFDGAQEDAKQRVSHDVMAEASVENIRIVIDYYNDLLVCMEKGACDRTLAESLIGQDIRNFYCKARYVGLPQLRETYDYAQYGERLARFAGSCTDVVAPAA